MCGAHVFFACYNVESALDNAEHFYKVSHPGLALGTQENWGRNLNPVFKSLFLNSWVLTDRPSGVILVVEIVHIEFAFAEEYPQIIEDSVARFVS